MDSGRLKLGVVGEVLGWGLGGYIEGRFEIGFFGFLVIVGVREIGVGRFVVVIIFCMVLLGSR